jgi:excisionase family DNA binding protein
MARPEAPGPQETISRGPLEPLGISVDEACLRLGCSRPHIYALVKKGVRRGFHLGDLFRLDYAHLKQHIETDAAMPRSNNPRGRYPKVEAAE